MKKRIISLLLAFVMVISLAPAALAAPGEEAPYSLKYLEGIEGTKYMQYMAGDDYTNSSGALVTQYTGEFYDVVDLWNSVKGDWDKIVAPFRQKFKDAGFQETSLTDDNNEAIYIYQDGSGDRFIIDGKTDAQSYLSQGAAVLVEHLYSESYKQTQETTQPQTPAASNTAPYSKQYLDGIAGVEYVDYVAEEDTVNSAGNAVTQETNEVYDVSALSASVGGDWTKIIAPFRQRFQEAGFQESADVNADWEGYIEPEFYYDNAAGDRFVICGKTWTEEGMGSSGYVVIWHAHCVDYAISTKAPTGTLDNFKKSETYTAGQFKDVKSGAWYEKTVQSAYELGLVKGSGEGAFSPDNPITVAEALALACRISDIFYGGTGEFTQGKPWYQVYVDYALENGIILESDFTDYTAPATREEFAYIMYFCLPDRAFPIINYVGAADIPDSGSLRSEDSLRAVLWLYNAGILTGSGDGSFKPQDPIKRSEVATIVARMVIASERVKLS